MPRPSLHRWAALLCLFLCLPAWAGLPTQKARSLAFTDTDLYKGTIGGQVRIGRAADENNITSYVLRWGLAGGCSAITLSRWL